MKIQEVAHIVKPDTYEASMALNQLLRIGQHAVKLHNLIKDEQEMESWVAKKIDLAGDYVKKVYNYMQGEKAGFYESKEEIGDYAKEKKTGKIVRIVDFEDDIYTISYGEDKGENDVEAKDLEFLDQTGADQEEISKFDEDAGEGHMSKSTLYHTAKYAIQLMQMIDKGDDLEGWVQSKLNKAADYLQGAYNYEEYQKLSPYREDLDVSTFAKHKEIIKKNIDEILAKETKLDDIDTKPGMMRILGKRVNEVEKKLVREFKMKKPRTMQDYKAMMKAVQDVERMPQIMKDPEMRAKVKQRKMQLQKDIPVLDKEFDDQPRDRGQRLDVGEDKYEFRGNPFPILGKAESYLNYGSDMAKAILNNSDQVRAMAETYLDRVPSFVNTEMKEIFPKTENVKEDGHTDIPSVMRNCDNIIEDANDIKNKVSTMQGELPSWMTEMIAVASSDLDAARNYLVNPKSETIDEDVAGFLKKLAAAGIIVGTMAGAGSILTALDNSVPAVQAMNKAYDMAMDAGNEELAKMIKNDISAVKVRLSSGRDLNFVKSMQDKYIKFMPKTEAVDEYTNTLLTKMTNVLGESWSKKYKKSINCANPKGFSQKAHCAGRKARQSGKKTKSKSVA